MDATVDATVDALLRALDSGSVDEAVRLGDRLSDFGSAGLSAEQSRRILDALLRLDELVDSGSAG